MGQHFIAMLDKQKVDVDSRPQWSMRPCLNLFGAYCFLHYKFGDLNSNNLQHSSNHEAFLMRRKRKHGQDSQQYPNSIFQNCSSSCQCFFMLKYGIESEIIRGDILEVGYQRLVCKLNMQQRCVFKVRTGCWFQPSKKYERQF